MNRFKQKEKEKGVPGFRQR